MINCYIVDDEPVVASLMIEYVNRHEELFFMGYESDPFTALSKIQSGQIKPDVCFLDIQMAGIGGLEIAKAIKHLSYIVFTTGYTDYAAEAYELDATDYLLKPVRYVRFQESIEKVKRALTATKSPKIELDYFFVKDVNRCNMIKIIVPELQVIEGCGNFVKLHIRDANMLVMTNLSMAKVMETIKSVHFVQVHKSYIINLYHVASLMGNEITMEGGAKIPLSKHYKGQFISKLNAAHEIK
jgi:Response regulator of the LytR/AlgR family